MQKANIKRVFPCLFLFSLAKSSIYNDALGDAGLSRALASFRALVSGDEGVLKDARPGINAIKTFSLPAAAERNISISRPQHESPASLLRASNIVPPLNVGSLPGFKSRDVGRGARGCV